MRPAPPVEPDYDGLSDAEVKDAALAYNNAAVDYEFRYTWLPAALSQQEYLGVCGLPVGYLEELYPWIAMFGPFGSVWEQLLLRLAHTLDDAQQGQSEALVRMRDFIHTYGDVTFFATAMSVDAVHLTPSPTSSMRDTSAWGLTNELCIDTYRVLLHTEVDELAEPLIVRVVDHPVWGSLISDPAIWVDDRMSKSRLLNAFSITVLVGDLMAREPAFARELQAHHDFLARWDWA